MSDTVIVELTDAGPQRIRGNGCTFEPGDRREVSPEHADALPDYWRPVDDTEDTEGSGDTDGEDLSELTKAELYDRATERDIDGRSDMTKAELIDALE